MFSLDPMTILTGGLHLMDSSLTSGYLSVVGITVNHISLRRSVVLPPPVLSNGGSDGYGYDPNYSPLVVEPITPKVIHSIEDIAAMIRDVDGDEINITIEYKPRNRKNIVIECQLIEKRISAELASISSKTVKVSMIYTSSEPTV